LPTAFFFFVKAFKDLGHRSAIATVKGAPFKISLQQERIE